MDEMVVFCNFSARIDAAATSKNLPRSGGKYMTRGSTDGRCERHARIQAAVSGDSQRDDAPTARAGQQCM